MTLRPPTSTLFPYTTLFRSYKLPSEASCTSTGEDMPAAKLVTVFAAGSKRLIQDRKSTRLNSSPPCNLVCRLLLEKKKKEIKICLDHEQSAITKRQLTT